MHIYSILKIDEPLADWTNRDISWDSRSEQRQTSEEERGRVRGNIKEEGKWSHVSELERQIKETFNLAQTLEWTRIFSNYHHLEFALNIRTLNGNSLPCIMPVSYISALISLSFHRHTPSTLYLRVYSLSIHSIHHLDINLQFIQREQHPVSAVKTPPQINQIYLRRGEQMVNKLCKLHAITKMYISPIFNVCKQLYILYVFNYIPSFQW